MRRQRGVLAFATPLLIVLIVILATMAMDGARLYSLRQEMQSQVNAAALAAADSAKSCGGSSVTAAGIRQRALIAARAQGYDGTDDDLLITAGLIEDGEDSGTLAFHETASIEQTNAVMVRYQRDEPISALLPSELLGAVTIDVNAAARKEVIATISASGGTAGIDGGLLGGLLGAVLGQPSYTLDPTSLSSLRNTTVKLGSLLQVLQVDQVTDILPLGGEDLANALREVGGITAPVANVLDDLAGASGIETIQVSDIISVVEGSSVPESSEFPLYDVVISLVLNLAERQQAGPDGILALPVNVDLSLPAVADISAVVGLHVGEPSTVAIGPARRGLNGDWRTRFYAPDITLLVDATVNVLSLPGVSVGVADISLPLAVNAGGGNGAFTSALCARGTDNDVLMGIQLNRSVARIASGRIDPATGAAVTEPVEIELLNLLPLLSVLSVEAEIEGEVPGVSENVILDPEYPLYCDDEGCAEVAFEDYGQGLSGLDLDIDVSDTKLLELPLGWLLNPLLNGLTGLLDGVVSLLATALINPLLETLGLGLGSMSVMVSNANQQNIQLIENVAIVELRAEL
ncbi:hypothetical protein Y5W_00657 [Alcanivorax sp. 521-1]|uniref:Putative Flp pilus-assembly TadG-like N-terminal domain-containing protein n=1 Tax=Alloalcanivorax profundimaris TaxID=2735259 RepID=A0ABS0AMK4_9GAMM|nr:pilus assembly protein TadG-related protein [Alloalcanivorax profundimaris]MBF5055363.1 hypothetical protein [Alloalcanivorax profundimaris]